MKLDWILKWMQLDHFGTLKRNEVDEGRKQSGRVDIKWLDEGGRRSGLKWTKVDDKSGNQVD